MTCHRRRRQAAQAVLETALVIPIMLILVFNFLGLMILVEGQNQLHSALSLAARSITVYPAGADQAGCYAASRTFWPTVYGRASYPWQIPSWDTNGCTWSLSPPPSPPAGVPFTITQLSCQSPASDLATNTASYFDWNFYISASHTPNTANPFAVHAITCMAKQQWDFSHSVLGPFILWQPTFTAFAYVQPPATRQCAPSTVSTECSPVVP